MRWPRLTTRRIMVAVALLGVALGLGVPAVQVIEDTSPHVHGWAGGPNDLFGMAWEEIPRPPFWLCYRQRLSGRDRDGLLVCGMGQGRLAETCYLGNLGVMNSPEQWHDRVTPTAAMLKGWEQ